MLKPRRFVLLGALAAISLSAMAQEPGQAGETVPADPAGEPISTGPAPPPPKPSAFLVDRLAAGAYFAWLSSDSLRYLGRIHFDFPFFVARQKGLYVRGRLDASLSSIERERLLRFRVKDADYLFELGARDYLSSRTAVAAFVGQQGSENLDQPGSAWVRYAGLGAQSASFPRPGGENRLDWNLNVAPVIDQQSIDASWVVRADILWDAVRFRGSSLGLDVSMDTIVYEAPGKPTHHWGNDWRFGPRWSFDLDNGIRASLFAQYLHSHNPLGVGASGTMLGFSYTEGAYRGPRQDRFPDVRGTLAAGLGDDRSPGTFLLEAYFPTFSLAGRPATALVAADANILAGRGPDNAFYILSAGVDLELPHDLVGGFFLRHRSYDVLGESGGESVDLNMVEAGVRTAGWNFSDRTPGQLVSSSGDGWPGSLEWTLGAAYILSSSLPGEEPQWIGRGGIRWDLPAVRQGVVPYLLVSGDAGEVSRARAGVGLTLPVDMAVSAEYRRDNQIQGEDKDEVALVFTLYY
jgi:hypothetical protein